MANELTDNEIDVLLILVVATFIKVVYTTTVYYSGNLLKTDLGEIFYKFIDKTKTLYSSFINLLSLLIGVYFIFIKRTDNLVFILAFSLLIFKAIMHFLVTYKLYKLANLSAKNEKKLLKFKIGETILTNYALFFLTLYIIKVVYF
jgi:hypothetical protein